MAIPNKVFNVLFICDDDTVRAPIAASLLNARPSGGFRAFSAGIAPSTAVPAATLDALRAAGAPAEGLTPVPLDDFRPAGAPHMDFVFTLTEPHEACSIGAPLPGAPVVVPWPIPRPDLDTGSLAERSSRIAEVVRMIRRRVDLFSELPLDRLDALTLRLQAEGVHQRATDES
ncbi:hypothetical protein A6A04_07415 [Paramagnetospirillum marisnigri]|uniref:Phosphotyrosine protein phosphatase I domain-containing protein n=1 Tax=Paramagnetospirillum marisnigri TaxID=1285242 RepID=A0A178MAA5_9PROT|nr:hypothetical protein [Paramagnetospirillum marisnigri]OAN45682.1 hypothetical protein A6A04_07285 [Paramagnetospirillum marisnigri]OAN45704.1 hypothetical protein A6A04_07415 [Paramagnetospirillum marisnigri]